MNDKNHEKDSIRKKYRIIARLEEIDMLLLGISVIFVLFVTVGLMITLMGKFLRELSGDRVGLITSDFLLTRITQIYSPSINTIFLLSLIIISKELWIIEKRMKLIYKKQNHERLLTRAKMVTK